MNTGVVNTGVLKNIISGQFEDVPDPPSRTLKVFVCSNKSDFELERSILWREVVPDVQYQCIKYGLDLVWIDFHHGIEIDHVQDTHSFQSHLLCMEECSREFAFPIFICLVGNKYGDCPLPPFLEESEFRHIRNEAFEGGKDIKLLDDWYIRDDNACPTVYRLKDISEKFGSFYRRHGVSSDDHQLDVEAWSYIYNMLLDLVQYGAEMAHKEGHINQIHLFKQQRFFSSGIEQEIRHAMRISTKNTIVMNRNYESINTADILEASKYIDMKSNACTVDRTKQNKLEQMKLEFDSKLPDTNNFNFCVSWRNGLQSKNSDEHAHYIENFAAAMATKIRQILDRQQRADLNFSPTKRGKLTLEVLLHLNRCKRLFLKFSNTGTEILLSEIQMILLKGSKTDHQAILIKGPQGCGKSVFVSKVCHRARELFGKETLLLIRFVGLTPQSRNSHEILRSICMQLNLILEQDISLDTYDLSLLTNYFHGLVNRISKGKQHLVIALDSIDKLEQILHDDQNNTVDWVCSKLPPKVHMILTYRHDENVVLQRKIENRILSKNNILTFPSWTDERYKVILRQNLSRSKRKLTQKQEMCVLSTLIRGTPLNVDIITEKAKTWIAVQDPNGMSLRQEHTEGVCQFLDHTEVKFGRLVIETICLYITLSQFGLTEMEILDLLSNNNDLLLIIYRHCLPNILRFPHFLWLQIRNDFGNLLCHRIIHNKSVICWSHDFIRETIKRRYYRRGETMYNIQSEIAQLFLETWVENKPLLLMESDSHPHESGHRMICPQPLLYSETKYNFRRVYELWLQLLLSGDIQGFKENAMCNFEYLLAMMHSTSIKVLLQNLKITLSKLLDPDVLLIYNALLSSETILLRYPTQLANELIGRLKDVKEFYSCHIESLVTQCMQWCDSYSSPLFVPLTTWLPTPQVTHIGSMEQIDGCCVMIPLLKNQHIICSFGLHDLAMYHVPSKTLMKIFSGHKKTVRCLIVSHGGNMFVSGSDDGTIRIWKIKEGVCTAVIREHLESVLCLALTPKDDIFVSGATDALIVVSNIITGKREHILKGHKKAVTSLRFNSNADILVSASRDATIILWYMDDMTKLGTIFDGIHSPILSMDISQDNTFVIVGCEDSSLNVIAFTTGTFIHQLTGHKGWINKIAIANDCYNVVAASQDSLIYLYNLCTTELLEIFQGHSSSVIDVRLSKDQTLIYSLSEGRLNVWRFCRKCTAADTTDDHTAQVSFLAISSDGRHALSGAENGEIKIWNMDASKFLENFSGHKSYITCIEVSTDGAFSVTSSTDKTLKVWSMTLAIVITNYTKHSSVVYNMKILEDDLRIISHDSQDNFQIWKADDGVTLASYTIPASLFILSFDNRFLITSPGDHSAHVWKTDSGALVTTVNHTEDITCFVCDVCDKFLVTGSIDKSCKIWELASGKLTQVLVEHDSPVASVLITNDSQIVISNAEDGNIMVWTVSNGETVHKLIGHIGKVSAMKLLSNNDYLVSASSDCTIRLWNIKSGRQVTMIDIHVPIINFVMCEDASRIAIHMKTTCKIPIICLHNSPCATDKVFGSQTESLISDLDQDDELLLPIQPTMAMRRNSLTFPVPRRPSRKKSSVSSIPQILNRYSNIHCANSRAVLISPSCHSLNTTKLLREFKIPLLSPMRAPAVQKSRKFKRTHLRVSFKPTKETNIDKKTSKVCRIL